MKPIVTTKNKPAQTKSNLKLNDIHFYENTKNIFQKAFVSLQCNCALCNTNLEICISQETDGEIKEEAFCPQCELRLRSKNYIIQ
jgi:hypothetical protein